MQIPNEIIKTGIAIDEKYFDLRGLATYSSLGVSTLRGFIKNCGLPHFAIRNEKGAITKILVKKSEFDSWMDRCRQDDMERMGSIVDSIIEEVSKKLSTNQAEI